MCRPANGRKNFAYGPSAFVKETEKKQMVAPPTAAASTNCSTATAKDDWICIACGQDNPSFIRSVPLKFCIACNTPVECSFTVCATLSQAEQLDRAQFENITREKMKAMLIREQELRLCEETQQAYCRQEDRDDDPMQGSREVTEAVQFQVAREFGFKDPWTGVQCLRLLPSLFPGDQELFEIPFYRRFNRAKQGLLKIGDTAPNLSVIPLDSDSERPLYDQHQTRPLVIFASSYS